MENQIAISESFDSIQGEGEHAGRRMFFIRTAGCSVGIPIPGYKWNERCITASGAEFICDTDFRVKERLTVEKIVAKVPVEVNHVCITGGEPLNHNLEELILQLWNREKCVHIETSGTVFPDWFKKLFNNNSPDESILWITVSPKLGVLPEMIELASEVKILIDKNFDIHKVPEFILEHENIFVQPVNRIDSLDEFTMKKAIELVMNSSNIRISNQLHKLWSIR